MGKLTNLNKARKKKARHDAAVKAAENRVRFGRSRVQREQDAAQTERAQRELEHHRRTPQDDE